MESLLEGYFKTLDWPWLLGAIIVCLAALGKSADWLVKEAVALSERSGVPKVIIGATIVSIGTTTPEAAVSVLAAIQGKPGLALGNAVGSIICDTGLILGLACILFTLPLPPKIVNRQGWVQLASGLLLVAVCWPWETPGMAFADDHSGRLSQVWGFVFLLLLGIYLWQSVRWSKGLSDGQSLEELEGDVRAPIPLILGKLIAAVAVVVVSSIVLIPAVGEAAGRMGIPEVFIASTLVAFGTSLPELVTALTAARRGHGDLAVGNIVGADILNVLFVAGAAAAVTPGGLEVSTHFYKVLFPAMLVILAVFRVGVFLSGDRLRRGFGLVLLVTYLAVLPILLSMLPRTTNG